MKVATYSNSNNNRNLSSRRRSWNTRRSTRHSVRKCPLTPLLCLRVTRQYQVHSHPAKYRTHFVLYADSFRSKVLNNAHASTCSSHSDNLHSYALFSTDQHSYNNIISDTRMRYRFRLCTRHSYCCLGCVCTHYSPHLK